jgi:hypothetical protein
LQRGLSSRKEITEPLSSVFGIFTISDKNDFYANAHESGRNHENWEAILKDFLALSTGK